MADYESMKSKFQILDAFNNFYKNVEYNLKLWLLKNKKVSVIQYCLYRFVIFRYEIHLLILCKYMDHNLELWLIRNGDVPDVAASLYNMLGFQT